MILRAYGHNALVELFEHHMVIVRRDPGLFIDGPSAEQFIPYASIRSVQFVRPSFGARGRIVFSLGAGATISRDINLDEHTVLFGKDQLREFEDVRQAVQRFIAVPSIERIAMSAAQNRGRIEQSAPPDTAARQEVIVAQPDVQREHSWQAYDHAASYDDRSFTPQPRDEHRPIRPTLGGWWSDMPLLGKIIAVGVGCFLLLAMCSAPSPEDDTAATSATEAAADTQLSADQMLSDWTEFVTGRAGTTGIALTDGTGKPGEFCSASDGKTLMTFGGKEIGSGAAQLYDHFFRFTGDEEYVGAFWFERSSGKLQALRLVHKRSSDAEPQEASDFAMNVSQISPGMVEVDGATFHSCII